MVEEEENDSFLKEFLARAQRRQAKLAHMSSVETTSSEKVEVSYPALSPLPEEDSSPPDNLTNELHNDHSNTEDRAENVSPNGSELDYSSDLSLQCDPTDVVYRAEPIVCHASPEHVISAQARTYPSPRKDLQTLLAQESQANITPLQELQPEQKPTSSQSLPSSSTVEQTIREFEIKVGRAEQTRTQLRKAVEVAKHGSKEHVEAARLLQIAELEHLTYTNQMVLFKQGLRKRTDSLGSITISDIKIKMSGKLRNDLADDGISHYFFCVASYGTDLKVTNMMNTNDIRRQDLKAYIHFKDTLQFPDLPPDFVVKLEVFELVTGQHLPKFLSRLTPSKRTKMTPESHFKRVGSLKLTLADRDLTHKNLYHWGEGEKSSYLERECKFHLQLKPEQLPVRSGMLHVRCLDSEGRPDWTRFWVDSSCGQVRFWQSRQDALDGKKPNITLEFRDICSEKVQKLTPDDDLYRQHSFVLYSYQQLAGGETSTLLQKILKDDGKFKVVKHQLAADSKEDRDSWAQILDQSLHCFREWYGKTKIHSLDELKNIFTSY